MHALRTPFISTAAFTYKNSVCIIIMSLLTGGVKPRNLLNIFLTRLKDNHVLACALYAKVDYLVTGGNDLLEVEAPGKLEVITPAQLMEII